MRCAGVPYLRMSISIKPHAKWGMLRRFCPVHRRPSHVSIKPHAKWGMLQAFQKIVADFTSQFQLGPTQSGECNRHGPPASVCSQLFQLSPTRSGECNYGHIAQVDHQIFISIKPHAKWGNVTLTAPTCTPFLYSISIKPHAKWGM